ncbi:MAG TPA: glycosyltransferase family A protein [Candidatus Hydrogenedentes bacterium]|nr:glycosyltransferase family A protein [Candidatus Hydrogenedentota bacterium]
MPNGTMNISVVICTYNRAAMLRLALESLLNQEVDETFAYEVVVVDDRSTDTTADVVAEMAARNAVPVRYVRAEGLGVAHARNTGVKAAGGDWVAFTDDDQLNDVRWLRELVAVAIPNKADVVGGTVALRLEAEPAIPLTEQTRSILGAKERKEAQVLSRNDMVGTGNLMIRRGVFDAIGFFDNTLEWGGEDDDFLRRVLAGGFRIWNAPKSVVYHMIPPYRVDVKYYRWASLRVGVAFAEVDARFLGRRTVVLMCVARLGKALLVHLPRYAVAHLRKNRQQALEHQCYLWRATSYGRQALFLIAPKRFRQERFFTGLKFRGERTTVGAASG